MKSEYELWRNHQKKSLLLHDGFENDFYEKKNVIQCPFCGGEIIFTLDGSKDFCSLNGPLMLRIAKKQRGIKISDDQIKEYTYKGASVIFSESTCSDNQHRLVIFFTFQEVQYTRYISYLIGVFDSDILSDAII